MINQSPNHSRDSLALNECIMHWSFKPLPSPQDQDSEDLDDGPKTSCPYWLKRLPRTTLDLISMKSERDVRDGHGELLDARDEGAPQDVLRILQAQFLRYCNDAGLQYTPQYSEVKRWFGDDPIIQNDIAAAVVNQRVADDNAKIIDASIGDWAKQDLPDCPGVNPGYYRHLASQFLNTNSGNIDIIYDMGIGDSVNRIPSSKAALTHFVEEIDADKIAQQMVDLARRMRPAFDAYAEALRTIKVSEISVGCAITAEAGLVFAGVGVEASMEITFDLT